MNIAVARSLAIKSQFHTTRPEIDSTMPAQKPKSAPQKKGGQLAVPVPDRPPWVSDELWQRSQDTAQLVERLKALNGASTEPGCSQAEVIADTRTFSISRK